MDALKRKIKKAVQNPALILEHLTKKNYGWADKNGLKVKKYSNYNEYVRHQRSKLYKVIGSLESYDTQYREVLHKRLIAGGIVQPSMNVLCLAARIGTEVKAFIDLGCFAIGIDLNPGENNKYVVTGDFHHIVFADHSVDVVFSNSIDHVFDLDAFLSEIKRVLKPTGHLILEIVKGENEGIQGGYYESIAWNTVGDLVKMISARGFSIESRKDFEYPWFGEHVCFRVTAKNNEK